MKIDDNLVFRFSCIGKTGVVKNDDQLPVSTKEQLVDIDDENVFFYITRDDSFYIIQTTKSSCGRFRANKLYFPP